MITLSHPYISPTTTITLPNPQLGNSVQLDHQVQFKKTMSGTLRTTIRTPLHSRLVLTFEILKNSDMNSLISFFRTVRHAEFRYKDHLLIDHKCKFPMSNYAYNWIGRFGRAIQVQFEELP